MVSTCFTALDSLDAISRTCSIIHKLGSNLQTYCYTPQYKVALVSVSLAAPPSTTRDVVSATAGSSRSDSSQNYN